MLLTSQRTQKKEIITSCIVHCKSNNFRLQVYSVVLENITILFNQAEDTYI